MRIINVMWSGGSPFVSVHTVHQQILRHAAPGVRIQTWLLQDKAPAALSALGEVRVWGLSSRLLKGRGISALSRLWFQRRFRQALLRDDTQLVLIDGLGAARALLPALRGIPGMRAVVVFHGATRFLDKDVALFRGLSSTQLTLCAVSKTLATAIESEVQREVVALRCALDPDVVRRVLLSREQARQQLGIAVDHPQVLGAVGRLVAGKGFDYLISAFAQTLERRPDCLLVIVGEGRARAELEARIEVLGLQGKVLLPGYICNVTSLYSAFDWVLIPSQEEGLGLIVQEAVIARVPVLVSDLDVFHEQLGPCGRYVRVNDVDAWAEAIEAALDDSATQIAALQYAALDPEQAWQRFSQACSDVLSIGQ